MRKINTPFFLTIFLIIISNYSFGQSRSNDQLFLDINAGPTIFIGDIRSADFFPSFKKPAELGYAFGGVFGKEMGEYFNIRSQFIYGRLRGVKPVADLNFKTNFLSAGLSAELNLNTIFNGNNRSNLFVYGTFGLNYIRWDADLIKTTTSAIVKNNKSAAVSIPVGLKISYKLSSHLFLSMEGALHIVTSDLVDAKPGGITHDDINYNSIGLTYKFAKLKKKRKSLYQPQIAKSTPVMAPIISNDTIKNIEGPTEEQLKEEERLLAEPEKKMEEKLLSNLIKHERENDILGFVGNKADYRVTVLTSLTETNTIELQKQLNIPEKIIEVPSSSGVYHYLVGSFDKSWKAKELRNMLISVNSVYSAKVVLYKEGKTMDMQEAYNLAVAAQQKHGDTSLLKDSIYKSVKLVYNIPEKGLFFGVQILSVHKDSYPLQLITDLYDIQGNIMIDVDPVGGWSRLIVDGYKSLEEAIKAKDEMRIKGFIDAFVIAFYDGSRIPPSRIPQFLNKQNK